MAETKESTVPEQNPEEDHQLNNLWMVRPCLLYKEEYKDCKSIAGRFQQYFVHGKFEDCSSWSQDYINCGKWRDDKNVKACNEIIANEEARRQKRFKAHYDNNVWKDRLEPPENWNTPLPEWMQKRQENSFLSLKAQEIKEGKSFEDKSVCTIL